MKLHFDFYFAAFSLSELLKNKQVTKPTTKSFFDTKTGTHIKLIFSPWLKKEKNLFGIKYFKKAVSIAAKITLSESEHRLLQKKFFGEKLSIWGFGVQLGTCQPCFIYVPSSGAMCFPDCISGCEMLYFMLS